MNSITDYFVVVSPDNEYFSTKSFKAIKISPFFICSLCIPLLVASSRNWAIFIAEDTWSTVGSARHQGLYGFNMRGLLRSSSLNVSKLLSKWQILTVWVMWERLWTGTKVWRERYERASVWRRQKQRRLHWFTEVTVQKYSCKQATQNLKYIQELMWQVYAYYENKVKHWPPGSKSY